MYYVVSFSPPSLPTRSHSHSSNSSFEDDFGVRKEVLLHGTYDDYIKEYKSRSAMSSSSKAPPSMADIAAAYQKALSQVASALQQGSSSKVCEWGSFSVNTPHLLMYMYTSVLPRSGWEGVVWVWLIPMLAHSNPIILYIKFLSV